MKREALLAAGILLWASPSAAEPFGIFQRFCLETQGVPRVVEQLAVEAGWVPETRPAVQPELNMIRMVDPATTEASIPTGLITGRLPPFRGLSAETCSVTTPALRSELIESMNSWAGFDADQTGRSPMWVFTRSPDGVQQQPDLAGANGAALMAAARTRGPLFQVVLQEASVGPVLIQIRIAP